MESALWQARDVSKAHRPSRAYTCAMLSTRGSHPWLFTDVPPGLKSGTFDTYGQRPGLCYPAPSGLAGYFSLLAAGQRASPDRRILAFRAAVVDGGHGAARL